MTNLKAGMKITLLDKHGSQIVEGIIDEVNIKSIILENGDEFLIKHITRENLDSDGATVQIGVTAWL